MKPNFSRCAAFVAAVAAMALPVHASAQDDSCVPRAEARAVVANLLPPLLESSERVCRPHLGARSYLAGNAARLAGALQPAADRAWPQARGTLEVMLGSELPDSPALLQFGRMAIAEGVTSQLDASTCSTLDRLVKEIAPLPPENFAGVFALFLEVGLAEAEETPIRICEV